MILIYAPSTISSDEIQKQIDTIKDRLSIFFVDDNNILFSTEANQKLLRELIINHSIYLFYTKSIKNMNMSPTEIAELILFIIKNGNDGKGGDFQSETDNIYFTKKDMDIIYPTIFNIFKTKHK